MYKIATNSFHLCLFRATH